MMKERIVMAVFSKLGLPAPREVSARLYVNDDYYGVYTVIEAVDKTFLGRVFGENSGYLYEYQYAAAYHFEYLGSDPALYSPRFFDPKTHEADPDPAPIEAMIRTMNSASDADFPSAIARYLDLSLFMKHLAAEDFMAETDGILAGMNNFYLYRFNNKMSQFIAKDKDRTFGGEAWNLHRPRTPLLANASRNVLIRRAMSIPAARDAYLKTIRDAAQFTGSGSWMESEVTRIYNQIRQAVLDDPIKQCFNGNTNSLCTNAEFEAEATADLQFARERGDYATRDIAEVAAERMFAFADRGGIALTKTNTPTAVSVGYGTIETDSTSSMPAGAAILTYRQNGTVVTETSILSSPAIQHGLIYAEIDDVVKTGIAIANPGETPATISFSYTDANGKALGQGSLVIPAAGQISRFLDESPFKLDRALGQAMRATMAFDSSVPVYVAALRGRVNERSEFVLSTLRIADPIATQGSLLIPHFADGGGWSTLAILTNPSTQAIQGTIQFVDQKTRSVMTAVAYSIAPRSYFRFETPGSATTTQSGSVWIIPSGNATAPAAHAILSFRKGGVMVSEASVPALAGSTAYRLYVENSDTVQTGIAIANPSQNPITVNLEATTLSGSPANLAGMLTIPGNGQVSQFLAQIPGFERIGVPFQGVLRISTTSATGTAVAGLRGRYNERGDFLVTTIPGVDETASNIRTELAFPHYVEGGGYTTQFVLFSGTANSAPTGVIRLFDQSGNPISAW
jgi:hypothetical protein